VNVRQAYDDLCWRLQPVAGLWLGFAIAVAVGAFFFWIEWGARRRHPGLYIPYQWVCHSKYEGGYCERTGGFDSNGRPWGTAVPRPPEGKPSGPSNR
jgi:hypothetical protein